MPLDAALDPRQAAQAEHHHLERPPGLAPSAQAPHLGIEHIGLAVEDIEATHADLRCRNATIVSGITDVRPGLRVLFIEGPDAVRIEFLQRSDAP